MKVDRSEQPSQWISVCLYVESSKSPRVCRTKECRAEDESIQVTVFSAGKPLFVEFANFSTRSVTNHGHDRAATIIISCSQNENQKRIRLRGVEHKT